MKILKFLAISAIFLGIIAVVLGFVFTKGDLNVIKAAFITDQNYEYVVHEGTDAVNDVYINVTINDVVFLKSDDETYKVEYYESEQDNFEFSVEEGKLSLKNTYQYKFRFFNFNFQSKEVKTIKVYLPLSYNKEIECISTTGDVIISDFNLEKITVKVTTGDISIKDTTVVTHITATSTTGNLTIENVNAVKLTIAATTGDTSIRNSNITNEVKVNASTGKITIDNVNTLRIDVVVSTGDIKINNVVCDDIDTRTTTGDIVMTLNGNENDFQVNLSTSTGSIKYQGIKSKGQIITSTGTKSIYAKTTTGNINIQIHN